MIKLILKTLLLRSFRAFGFPKVLPINLTILISTVCNSRCLTCNIWKQKHNDLTLEEWEKVFLSLGKTPYWLTISGGEPFLPPHLADLAILAYKYCRPKIINIPTNSLLVDKVEKDVEKILKSCPKTRLIINLSLDGVGAKHDQIRGVPGNFLKVMENYRRLKKIQKKYPHLTLGLHSVVSKFNIDHLPGLADFALSLNPDQYITEIAEQRAELDTVGLPITPSDQEYAKTINNLIKCIKAKNFQRLAKISEAFRLEYYDFVKKWLKGEKITLKDYAGWASAEITSWGEVWPSCMKGIGFGNLRQTNYNFPKIWFGQKAQKFRKEYKNKPESFPLANAFYTNALFNFPTLAKVLRNLLILTLPV